MALAPSQQVVCEKAHQRAANEIKRQKREMYYKICFV